MVNKKEIVLKFELDENLKKTFIKFSPFLAIGFVLFFSFLYSLISLQLPFRFRSVVVISFFWFLFKIALYIFIGSMVFIGPLILYLFVSNYKNNIVARANKDGVWIKYHNFIPWEYIEKVEEFLPSYSPNAQVQAALWIKFDPLIRKKLSIGTRMGIFWSKVTGYQHITTGSMDGVKTLEFIRFAQDCLKK